MDTSWFYYSRYIAIYESGLAKYLDYLYATEGKNGQILCHCIKCVGLRWRERDTAEMHLLCDGFMKGYKIDTSIPETVDSHMFDAEDDMLGLVNDAFHGYDEDNIHEDDNQAKPNKRAKQFYKSLKNANKELYPGCKKFTVLSFIVRLFHSKCVGKCNDKGFGMILETLREAFPDAAIPKSLYELRTIIKDLGLGYEKIDACPNDCILYWKENQDKTECHVCNASRYKESEDTSEDESDETADAAHKVGAKVVRYFPLVPRLQRLFMSSESAASMRWHEENRTKDGYMRHPADSPAWKRLDTLYPDFAMQPRNVRLGLASDGFNPFGNMSVSHSTWPVVLIPYNLPPWMCMKKPYLFLTILIPGPSAPGNNIDVYMQPLVAELKELWDKGVETYDSSTKINFQMRACLLWTINDFPAYANLSGWSTKGKLACPCCHKHTRSRRLTHGKKSCFMGHRRWLDTNHAYRKNKRSFDGTEESEVKPSGLSGSQVLGELEGYEITFGKHVKTNPSLPFNWKKRSIFFELPYWRHNLIRHNLDVMHTEKNVCESVVGTILNLDGKTKDHLNARLDLEEMKIRKELHPQNLNNKKVYLPPACFSMDKNEKELFCLVLKGVKVPDGYSANISRCIQVKPPKLLGLKSHDYHILMQQLLPLAIRKVLPKHVRAILMKLSRYYRQLCMKVINPNDLVQMEKDIGKILCDLERIFPPSFFDVMVHLSVHLASEAKLGGPVQYRWMYFVERYLGTLKTYVRNKSKPEGSIAEGYLAEECLSFCSLYLNNDVETVHNKKSRNHGVGGKDGVTTVFSKCGRPIGAPKKKYKVMNLDQLAVAHSYVLFNCSEVDSFRNEHLEIVQHKNRKLRKQKIQRLHSETFESWFQDHVEELYDSGDSRITEDINDLASGPSEYVKRYNGYIVNGYRFQIKDIEKKRKTQNSGVMLEARTDSFASSRDNNPIVGDVTYYGVVKEIIELTYASDKTVVVFRCDWISQGSRIKEDENGFTLLNFAGLKPDKEPFILASQAKQVFYVKDPVDNGWKVVIKTTPRDTYEMDEETYIVDVETHLQCETSAGRDLDDDMEIELVRGDLYGTVVDTNEGDSGDDE